MSLAERLHGVHVLEHGAGDELPDPALPAVDVRVEHDVVREGAERRDDRLGVVHEVARGRMHRHVLEAVDEPRVLCEGEDERIEPFAADRGQLHAPPALATCAGERRGPVVPLGEVRARRDPEAVGDGGGYRGRHRGEMRSR